MVGGVKAYYAVLLALVLGVGCGAGKETNSGTLIQTGSTKTCYWCKESIKTAALVCKHCGKNPSSPSAQAIEKAVRKYLEKPEGELTKADLEKVTSLYLAFRELTDVTALKELTQLEWLYLGQNQLTNVKGLEKLTQLTTLGLGDNQLTDVKGLEKLTQLKSLDLSGNQLTDVKGLEKLTQLKTLYLHNYAALTKAQIDELRKALPKCRIISNPKK